MAKNVVALFDRYEDAQAAVEALEQAGFSHENISVIASKTQASAPSQPRSSMRAGILSGALVGLISGLAALAIPDVAAFLWYGPLLALLVGAGLGALVGWSVRRMPPTSAMEGAQAEGEDLPKMEGEEIIAEGVRRGGTVVMAYVQEADADRAAELLYQHDPVEINHRTQAMQQPQVQRAARQANRASAARAMGARRPTAPMRPFPVRAPGSPLDSVQGQLELVRGKTVYDYDRRGAEMGQYRNPGSPRPELPEKLELPEEPGANQ